MYSFTSKCRKIYIIGSGSSYSQAIYTQQLIKKYLDIPVFYDNPYSFVRNTNLTEKDVVIHVTQEAKRMIIFALLSMQIIVEFILSCLHLETLNYPENAMKYIGLHLSLKKYLLLQ
ncbi:MAG: SIS domain-containing protein [Thermales bacterium]|nr:SIS domain-containing protein [Thermales bacterium]